jgi:hypothetical protein
MTKKTNVMAADFWSQIFATLANDPAAAVNDPEHDATQDEVRMREGMAAAGWTPAQVEAIAQIQKERTQSAPSTSPGINPQVEAQYAILCDSIEAAMQRLNLDSYANVARGVEPRTGPFASKINVISTELSIVTVGAFLFRFCGLIARAFTRTFQLNPWLWNDRDFTPEKAKDLLKSRPDLLMYWMKIYLSFGVTGTHVAVPYKPSTSSEVILMEQIARAMEIFAIAHEYGHHHLAHGKVLGADAKEEEFGADQFALKISEEVEKIPLGLPNPFLTSGSGGAILLMALNMLSQFERALGAAVVESDTHPAAAARIAKFDSIKVLFPAEFAQHRSWRVPCVRLMEAVEAQMSEILAVSGPEMEQMGALREKIVAEATLKSRI